MLCEKWGKREMKKKCLIALSFMMWIFTINFISVYAEEKNTNISENAIQKEESVDEVVEQNGFEVINGKVIYYINGQLAKDCVKTIDGVTYRFDADGYLEMGLQKDVIDFEGNGGDYYYTNQAPYYYSGELKINNNWYYFDEKGRMIKDSFHDFSTKTVYYGIDGTMKYGEQKINGNWYYFNTYNGAMITGFYDLPTKTVYYDETGKMLYGHQMINGEAYYFDEYSGARYTGFSKNANDQLIYYGEKGQMVKGEQKINGNWYYFDENGVMLTNVFQKLTGKTVYYGADGTMRYGEQKIDGNWYYFDVYSGAMKTGFYN